MQLPRQSTEEHCQASPGGAASPTPGLTPTPQQSTSVTLTLRRQCGGRGSAHQGAGGPRALTRPAAHPAKLQMGGVPHWLLGQQLRDQF